jgi:hypothetical protein
MPRQSVAAGFRAARAVGENNDGEGAVCGFRRIKDADVKILIALRIAQDKIGDFSDAVGTLDKPVIARRRVRGGNIGSSQHGGSIDRLRGGGVMPARYGKRGGSGLPNDCIRGERGQTKYKTDSLDAAEETPALDFLAVKRFHKHGQTYESRR